MSSKKLYLLSIFLSIVAYYLIDNLWIYWLIGIFILFGALSDIADFLNPIRKYEKAYYNSQHTNAYLVNEIKSSHISFVSSSSGGLSLMDKPRNYFNEFETKASSSVVLSATLPSGEMKESIVTKIDDSWTKGRKFEEALVVALQQNKNQYLGLHGDIVDYGGSLTDKDCKVDIAMESERVVFLFQCKCLLSFGYASCKNINIERAIASKKYNNYFSCNKEKNYIIVFDSKMKIFDKNNNFVHKEKIKKVMDEYFEGVNDGHGLQTSYLFLDTDSLTLSIY